MGQVAAPVRGPDALGALVPACQPVLGPRPCVAARGPCGAGQAPLGSQESPPSHSPQHQTRLRPVQGLGVLGDPHLT